MSITVSKWGESTVRKFHGVVVAGVSVALLATLPAGAAAAKPRVPAPLFGQHVISIGASQPTAPARVGSIRLWDSGVRWDQVEKENNEYDWSRLDAAVKNAKGLGAKEILYTLGSTPRWAASDPNSKDALYGRGTNSHPAKDSYFTDYLKAVADRYKGDITSYQMWNEANLRDFYLGTPKQMARLTKASKTALKSVDRKAKLVAASTTVRSSGPVGKWGKNYGKAMKKVKWPVHAVSAHFYPPATSGPGTRVSYIKKIKKYYKKYGAKSKPLWDTEMNYGDRRTYVKVKRTYTGAKAQGYVARTYIDSMRYKVSRVFWYAWDNHILGIDMVSPSNKSVVAAGGTAFLTLQDWMVGAKWYGCKKKKKITTCTVKPRGGSKDYIRYTTSKSKKFKVPAKTVLHNLDGTSKPVRKGQRVKITTVPVMFG